MTGSSLSARNPNIGILSRIIAFPNEKPSGCNTEWHAVLSLHHATSLYLFPQASATYRGEKNHAAPAAPGGGVGRSARRRKEFKEGVCCLVRCRCKGQHRKKWIGIRGNGKIR